MGSKKLGSKKVGSNLVSLSSDYKLCGQSGQSPFRSEKIEKIFQALLLGGGKLAKDLAKVINTDSKQIYPRVRRYILKGWVQISKVNNMNIYSLTETAKNIILNILKQKFQGSFDRIKEKAEKILGRKLDEDEAEILRFFFKEQGYIENSPTETIAEQVYHSVGRKISLTRVEEILTEFTKAKVLFAYRLRNGAILKVRLNKNLL